MKIDKKKSWFARIRPGGPVDILMAAGIVGACGVALYFAGYYALTFLAWAYNTATALVRPARTPITPVQALAALIAFSVLSSLCWGLLWGAARAIRHATGTDRPVMRG
jgi:ABC-type Na+ efflux pump permease subunit